MYDIWEINKTGDTWLDVQIWMIHIGDETGMEFLDRLLEKGYPKEMFDYFQQINVLHGLININGIMYTPRHAIINSEIFKDFIKKSNCCTECGIVFNEEELEFQLCPNCRKEIFEKSRKYEMERKGNVSLFLKNERTK